MSLRERLRYDGIMYAGILGALGGIGSAVYFGHGGTPPEVPPIVQHVWAIDDLEERKMFSIRDLETNIGTIALTDFYQRAAPLRDSLESTPEYQTESANFKALERRLAEEENKRASHVLEAMFVFFGSTLFGLAGRFYSSQKKMHDMDRRMNGEIAQIDAGNN